MLKLSKLAAPVLFLLFCSPLLIKSEEKESSLPSFGQQCNETVPCDTTKSLNCSNGICECQNRNSQSLIYDSELSTCVVRANKVCVIENPVSLTLTEAISLEAPALQTLPCVKNSDCNLTSKLCVCDNLLMPSENGTCIAKKVFGEVCSASSDCRRDLGLLCSEKNVCTCDPESTIYDETQFPNVCLGKAEKPCIKDKCTLFASCVEAEEWKLELKEVEVVVGGNESIPTNVNSTIPPPIKTPTYTLNETKKICQCNEDHDSTPSGLCAKDYGIKCDKNRSCKPWFNCGESGVCECHHPTNQIYDEEKGVCVSLVDGPCNSNLTIYFGTQENYTVGCSVAAECVLKPDLALLNQTAKMRDALEGLDFESLIMVGSCSCIPGYIQNEERGCDLGYGMECKNESSQSQNLTDVAVAADVDAPALNCSKIRRMTCRNSTCQCEQPNHEYDEEEEVCVSLVGKPCKLDLKEMLEQAIRETDEQKKPTFQRSDCTRDAVCKKAAQITTTTEEKNGTKEMTGVCECITRNVGHGKCGHHLMSIILIGIAAGVALLATMIAIPVFSYAKRQGYLVNVLSQSA
ncbi:unnamed protein product [Orchesella dallaii]|uniref:Uncharacterized protein n=1 Tax=Orchesella dallaii TaxID=48710 RepID=A0ABP1RC20_9HEXA